MSLHVFQGYAITWIIISAVSCLIVSPNSSNTSSCSLFNITLSGKPTQPSIGLDSICIQTHGLSNVVYANGSTQQVPLPQMGFLDIGSLVNISRIALSIEGVYFITLLTYIISRIIAASSYHSIRALVGVVAMLGAMYTPIVCGASRSVLQQNLRRYGDVSIYFGSIFSISIVLLFFVVGEAISQIYQHRDFKIEPRDFKIEPRDFKIEPRDFKIEPTDFKIEPTDSGIKAESDYLTFKAINYRETKEQDATMYLGKKPANDAVRKAEKELPNVTDGRKGFISYFSLLVTVYELFYNIFLTLTRPLSKSCVRG